ncbi:MAG TPA: GMC family oxidoreductase [Stellaceae bacterium]|nr:GMC family oxidoreductase [Stellaceae bacterium]
MFVDARSVPGGTVIESELCIVGAGAAGITIARELIGAGFRVALIESGGLDFDSNTQALYAGSDIGRPFLDLTVCRLRYFGGTTNHWGGWCLPLDPVDFETRPGVPHSGWPFDRPYLDPWYKRAQPICQLGPFDYDIAAWGIDETLIPDPFRGPDFVVKMLQESPPTRFGEVYRTALQQAGNVTVYLNANALFFAANDEGTEVSHLPVKTLSGVDLVFKAKFYVLAAGGIENARLLLLSGRTVAAGIGQPQAPVGRYFMTHLVYRGGVIVPTNPYIDLDFFTGRDGIHHVVDGVDRKFVSYFGLSDDTMRRQSLSGARFLWMYKFAPVADAVDAVKRLAERKDDRAKAWTDLGTVFRNIDGLAEQGARKVVLHEGLPVEALDVGFSSEQLPNPESRVELGTDLDPLGLPRVAVDWQVTADDKRHAYRTVSLLGAELGKAGFGRLKSSLVDDDTTWPDNFYGDEHHTGTTRMHRDPTQGVVDENCCVHGVANLHVAGSSVFPTIGSANPTLTIVALALRLADYLKRRLV